SALGLLFAEVPENLLDAVLMLDRFIEAELDLRHPAQAEATANLASEERRRTFERGRRLAPGGRVAHHRVVHPRHLQVWRHLDARQRDEPDPRIVDHAPREELAQLLTDLVADAIRSMSLRHSGEVLDFRA